MLPLDELQFMEKDLLTGKMKTLPALVSGVCCSVRIYILGYCVGFVVVSVCGGRKTGQGVIVHCNFNNILCENGLSKIRNTQPSGHCWS